jgi:hypothetical protein
MQHVLERQYAEYRLFVAYHLKKLKMLDACKITRQEKDEASKIYRQTLNAEFLFMRLKGNPCPSYSFEEGGATDHFAVCLVLEGPLCLGRGLGIFASKGHA